MDFFKIKRFRKAHKPNPENSLEDMPVPQPEEPQNDNIACSLSKTSEADRDPAATNTAEEDDDDDFITNEVKRRLKELRRNSFMVLIPEEESCLEEEEEEEEKDTETISNEWRNVEAEGRQWWSGCDAVYEKYCECMLFFDRMSAHQLKETGSLTPSPKSAPKKLTSPFRCLALKKMEETEEETEHLQQSKNDPCQDLETAYVAQTCLSWEALHCQYTQLSQKISCQQESATCYNHCAQQFQQFLVLLQRFIENEPFEQGVRAEIYARARILLPKLLQVPIIKASELKEAEEEESDFVVRVPDLLRIIESSILTFHLFLKMEKRKSNVLLNLFSNQNQNATPLQQMQCSLEKKRVKLKELRKKKKGWKKSWPRTREEIQILFGLVDVKIISMVLRMGKISTEQLFWCEEKMKKLDLLDGRLQRDPSPTFFPETAG